MNTEIKPICKNLQMLRHERDLSQSAAAKALGLSQVLLSHYENGARKPSLEFILRACDYYEVTADYMLGRSGIRDGGMPSFEETDTERRLVGMASAKLGQALLVSSLKVIYDIAGRTDSPPLISEITAMLGTAAARVLFRLCDAQGTAAEFFDEDEFETASAADLLIRDVRIGRELQAVKGSGKEMPELTYHGLEAQYPSQFKALLMLKHQACERVKKQR